ncbi:hypothetical protein AK812_SmicGene48566, partial [Symbiodinium microadriaticum]
LECPLRAAALARKPRGICFGELRRACACQGRWDAQ